MLKYEIAVPSRARAWMLKGTVFRDMPVRVKFVIHESEMDEYRRVIDQLRITNIDLVPVKFFGLQKTRNWIIENLYGDNDFLVMMDDDLARVAWAMEVKYRNIGGDEIADAVVETYQLGRILEVGSISWTAGRAIYQVDRHKPLKFRAKQYCCCIVLLDKAIRFDENVIMQDDFELSLRSLYVNGISARDERYAIMQYGNKMGEARGGIMNVRTRKTLKQDKEYIMGKYGQMARMFVSRVINGLYTWD